MFKLYSIFVLVEIRKLVMDFFKNFWFSPVKEQPSLECLALDKKVQNITKVISSNEINLELLEGLILNVKNYFYFGLNIIILSSK